MTIPPPVKVLKLRSDVVSRLFLLFPTIADIADTPNGKKLSWVFRPPLPRAIAIFAHCVYYLPLQMLGMLFPSYPRLALSVLHSLVRSPQAIFAALSMAHDEMIKIRQLDFELLSRHKDLLWFYFAQCDDWVGQQKAMILGALGNDDVRIFHGGPGIHHAFCVQKEHSEEMGRQCSAWLSMMDA